MLSFCAVCPCFACTTGAQMPCLSGAACLSVYAPVLPACLSVCQCCCVLHAVDCWETHRCQQEFCNLVTTCTAALSQSCTLLWECYELRQASHCRGRKRKADINTTHMYLPFWRLWLVECTLTLVNMRLRTCSVTGFQSASVAGRNPCSCSGS